MNDAIVHLTVPPFLTGRSLKQHGACGIVKDGWFFRFSDNPRDCTCSNCLRTSTFRHKLDQQQKLAEFGGRHECLNDTDRRSRIEDRKNRSGDA